MNWTFDGRHYLVTKFSDVSTTTAAVPFELIRTFVNEAAKDVGQTPGFEEGLGN